MPHTTPDHTFVLICDWQGHVVWRSSEQANPQIGNFAWVDIAEQHLERTKEAFAKTVSLRESSYVQVRNLKGTFSRIWFWPLTTPDSAVFLLCMQVPQQLALLTDREFECLELLAQGLTTKQIATKLDISLSTSQTHLKRSREKVGLPTSEALVSFAARFCNPNVGPDSFLTEADKMTDQ